MKFDRNALAAAVAGIALAIPGYSAAQDDIGAFESEYSDYSGVFEDDGIGDDDWYYDSYETGELDADAWWSDTEWYSNEYYSGLYDGEQGAADDWFFDTYDDPGDEGLFDV